MVRATFVKHLRKIGEIPLPEGHRKGSSCYFFALEKLEILQAFLLEHTSKPDTLGSPYPDGTLYYKKYAQTAPQYINRAILLWPLSKSREFLTVEISQWN